MSTFTKMQPNSGEKRRHESKRSLNLRRLLNVKSLLQLPFCKTFFLTISLLAHTIPKVKFLSKKSFLTILYNFLGNSKLSTTKKCKPPTFSRVFHPKIFLTIFLVKSKLSSAKKSKTTTFSPKTIQ